MIRQLNFSFGKRVQPIVQAEATECGLASIAMVAGYFGHEASLAALRRQYPVSLKGASLEQIMKVAVAVGLRARALKVELDELSLLATPAILHWNLNHFVVLESINKHAAVVCDPAVGRRSVSLQELSECFTGVALELTPGFDFVRKREESPIELGRLVGRVTGLRKALLQLFILAIALESLALVAPLFNQWILDGAIVSGDEKLLTKLAIGLTLVGMTHAAIGALRSWVALFVSSNFTLQWLSNVMAHLVGLPVAYFEKRSASDILSRFSSVNAIQRTLTVTMVDAVLDIILVIGTGAMMAVYSWKLATVPVLAALLYGFIKVLRFSTVRAAQISSISSQAREQAYFFETLRGIRSIKLANRHIERTSAWSNLWVDSMNANVKLRKLDLMFSGAWSVVGTLSNAAVLWIGAASVMNKDLSIGMFFAFISYKDQFAGRMNSTIDRVVEYKLLSVQTERLSDIVLTPAEQDAGTMVGTVPDELGLSLHDVSFSYEGDHHYLLRRVTLSVMPGECIAIVGPSGSGKTTLLKVLLGVVPMSQGTMLVGGIELGKLGLREYRDRIAAVMQDDRLFAGSVLDNICFMDERPDQDWAVECAKRAFVHDEISAMVMGYHTLIGDMGSALSGGQHQRILLARALYRRPQILFLDEATSHLDVENEKLIARSLANLSITRIMIAHRPETIEIADRIFRLHQGELREEKRAPPLPRKHATESLTE
jgi:ATP-binding cassette subfamily B protein RaxB